VLQQGNTARMTPILTKPSGQLADNRIGSMWAFLRLIPYPENTLAESLAAGVKRFRLSVNSIDSSNADMFGLTDELTIEPKYDDLITGLAEDGVRITYVLSFWDQAYRQYGGELSFPRFKTEDQIQRYLDYVKFIVGHFKGRVQYYEIWNEPSSGDSWPMQWIELPDYLNLVRRTVPVIRAKYPEAKIVVGGTHELKDWDSQQYLFGILNSDILPLVDVVAWHPMYGASPEYDDELRQYYYEYPSLVQKIQKLAAAHGFKGEFVADELAWRPPTDAVFGNPWSGASSEIKAAKYLARGILINLGLDVSVTQQDKGDNRQPPLIAHTLQNLCNIMAGSRTISLPVTIQSDAANIKSYGFALPNGNQLLALWSDGPAVDYDLGVPSTLVFAGRAGQEAAAIDVLNGLEQRFITSSEGEDLVIRNVLIHDYPILIRLNQ
jgi:hypothetical protein